MTFGSGHTGSRMSKIVPLALLVALLAGCAKIDMPAHLNPLSVDMMRLMAAKRMEAASPIFIRIFKAESELEIWKQKSDGRFYHLKSYPVCAWSGDLGPKIRQGDKQAPEGFYTVNRHQMNPNSSFHLSFDLGYPNAFDRANRRTGDFLMVHGDCTSAGCYAMTDHWIEEIYALAREAFIGGQDKIHVHAFPFRMTSDNMDRHATNEHIKFWKTLKEAYDHFNATQLPPEIVVCERRYVVNVTHDGPTPDPAGRCPRFKKPELAPFVPLPKGENEPIGVVTAPGPKKRVLTVDGEIKTVSGGLALGRFSRRNDEGGASPGPAAPMSEILNRE